MPANTALAPRRVKIRIPIAAISTVGNSLTSVVGIAPIGGRIVGVVYIPLAANTGNTSNGRTFTLTNRGAAGAGNVTAASLAQITGVNLAAFVPSSMTLSATVANRDVSAGEVLSLTSAAVGTGIADPGGVLEVEIADGDGAES